MRRGGDMQRANLGGGTPSSLCIVPSSLSTFHVLYVFQYTHLGGGTPSSLCIVPSSLSTTSVWWGYFNYTNLGGGTPCALCIVYVQCTALHDVVPLLICQSGRWDTLCIVHHLLPAYKVVPLLHQSWLGDTLCIVYLQYMVKYICLGVGHQLALQCLLTVHCAVWSGTVEVQLVWCRVYHTKWDTNQAVFQSPGKNGRATKRRTSNNQACKNSLLPRCRCFQHTHITLTRWQGKAEVCLPCVASDEGDLLSHSATFEGWAKKKLDDMAFLMHCASWHIYIVTLQMVTVTWQVSIERCITSLLRTGSSE